MNYNPTVHHRRSIRLQRYDYSCAGAYFITCCTHNRLCLFGNIVDKQMCLNDAGRIVVDEWTKTPDIRNEIILDQWVVMPNHFHGIMIITNDTIRNITGSPGYISSSLQGRPAGKADRGDHMGPVSQKGTSAHNGEGDRRVAPTGPKPRSIGAIMAGYKSAVTKRINEMRHTPGMALWQRNYWEHVIRDESEMDSLRQYIQNNPAQWEFDKLYQPSITDVYPTS